MHTLFLTLALLFLVIPIDANAANPETALQKIDSKIYKYTGKDGVTVFTNNIDSAPESLQKQVDGLEIKPKIEVKPEIKVTQSAVRTGLHSPFIRNILLMIVAIVLFWIIKLWIKNMILKFIARIAIKAAIIGLVY
ncbi:MAG: hypothetical protein HY037_02520, partial [Nitrospirae bacterium]|nr:hypothetical protein [Candidatus Troglogloeales bacterium]